MSKTASFDRPSKLDYIPVENLLLDPENPRLVNTGTPSQGLLLKQLYEQEALDELAPSLAENGYFAEEPLVVVRHQDGEHWIAVEGNRRLATLKLLLSLEMRKNLRVVGWPELTQEQRDRLLRIPCVIYPNREAVFPFLGFRHITGAKKWAPFQKARFVAQLIDSGRSLDDVQDLIGDTTQTVKKLYQDYVVYQQVTDDLQLPEKPIRDRFSLLEVTLGQRNIKNYLGIPRRLPSASTSTLVPEDKLDNLEEVVGWVFGTHDKAPVIVDSRTITSRLAPVLSSDEAVQFLRRTNDLEGAYDYSGGEQEYLMKRVAAAERALRDVSALISLYRDEDEVRSGVDRLRTLMNGLDRMLGSE